MYRYQPDHDMTSDEPMLTTCPNPTCRESYPVGRLHQCRNLRPQVRWDDGQDVHPIFGVVLIIVTAIGAAAGIGWLLSGVV